MNQEQRDRIVTQDVTAKRVRQWQYEFQAFDRLAPQSGRHSLNLLAMHRDRISGGHLWLFEGKTVMAESA